MRDGTEVLSADLEANQDQENKAEAHTEEKDPAVETRDHIAEEFLELERLAAGIVTEKGNELTVAGVAVDKAELDASLRDRVQYLQGRTRRVLGRTARRILTTGRNAALAGALTLGYTALDVNKQPPFADREKAQQELQEQGIPSDQRLSAYKPGISELLYEGITPLGYQNKPSEEGDNFGEDFFAYLQKRGVPNAGALQEFIPNVILGREDRRKAIDAIRKDTSLNSDEQERALHSKAWASSESAKRVLGRSEIPKLDDAWRLYLGLPQKENTFGISDYRPSTSKDDKYYYTIDGFWGDLTSHLDERDFYLSEDFQKHFVDETIREAKNQQELEQAVDDWAMNNLEKQIGQYIKKGAPLPGKGLKGYIEFLQSQPGQKMQVEEEVLIGAQREDIMFHYTMACGQDEKGFYIAYYDKWDLASFFAENPLTRGVGKPFEIYDRLYYDPTTYEVVK